MQSKLKSINLVKSLVLSSGNRIPQIALATHHVYGDQCLSRLRTALQAGYTHIEVARLYNNQEQIGKAIKSFGISRQKLFISAKLSFNEFGERGTRKACQDLLHNLGTSYVDMLMIHWPGLAGISPNSPQNPKIRLNTWNTMINLKKQGKAKDIGVANFLPRHIDTLRNSSELPVLNQIQLNPSSFDKQTIQYCKKHNIQISAISPLSRRPPLLLENPYVVQLFKKYNKTPSQIILNWGVSQGFIVCPKATTPDNIVNNMDIFDFEITPEEINKLTNLNIKIEKVFNPDTVKY